MIILCFLMFTLLVSLKTNSCALNTDSMPMKANPIVMNANSVALNTNPMPMKTHPIL